MPRLILLNGPSACGKSTLARRYVEDHPPALALDIDELRGMLGGWRDDQRSSGPEFIEQLADLVHEVGATFDEIVLVDGKPNMLRRFTERGDHPHGDASEQHLSARYDRLMALLPSRPDARIVPVQDGRPEETYQAVLSNLR